PSPTPTNAPSPTPSGTPTTTNLVQNGGFESSGNWTFSGTPVPVHSTTQAHSGSYSLRVGGTSGQQGNSIASQMVSIPSSATQATLSFWYWSASNDSSSYAWQEANVVSSSGQVLQQLFQTTANNRGWVQLTFDLSKYAGQTVGIQFLDYENSGGGPYYTYMYVDDVVLNVS
ncbi:MAG: hypothetical protein JO011_13310, partial [Ktedonobacteraceae bacterium]|nr:hypothetical protein [Ktedonobacteraceae bacterium]